MAKSASPAPLPSAAPRGKINRTAIGLNVSVQLLLTLVIIAFVNTMSFRHYARWDFSQDHNYALSSKTKNLLTQLEQPVHAYVFFTSARGVLGEDVSELLHEYDELSHRKFVTEKIDAYRNLSRARELAAKYNFKDNENIVILDYKDRHKIVYAYEMANFEPSPEPGQPPNVREFKGEEAITSALQGLLEEKQKKLYVVSGHGEVSLGEPDVAALTERVKRENIEFTQLNLGTVDTMPADASGILIFGPRADFSERDMSLLDEYYVHHKGRVCIFLNPDGATPRLDEWLARQAVKPQGDRILRTGSILAQGTAQSGIYISPDVIYAPAGRPVTKDLAGVEPTFLGFTESLLVDEQLVRVQKLNAIPLVISGRNFWGETEYVTGSNQPVFFDPKKDHMGPLIVGVALEKGALEDPRVKVETSRLIVVGNAGFPTDRGLQLSPGGDVFAIACLNWLFNRELLSGIPPKKKEAHALGLKEEVLNSIFWTSVVGVPLCAGLLGLYMSWFRRNRSLLTLTVWVLGVGLFIFGAGWTLNLYFQSRESTLNAVALKDYAIPAMLALVPLIIFIMHILRRPLDLPVYRDSV